MTKRRANGEGSIIFSEQEQLWIAQITLPDGKRRRKRSKLQKVVKNWLLAQRDAVRDGLVVADEKITLAQFLDRYVEDVAVHTLKPKTLQEYKALIRLHIKPSLGKIRLVKLTPLDVQRFYSEKLNSRLSKRTVQFIHSVLHKALEQALKWGMVIRNVSDLVEHPNPKRKAPTTWSIEQAKLFLQTVKDHRWYPIYVLAIYCGLREGEVLGIHFEDVDLLHSNLNICHAVQYLVGQGMVISEPKSASGKRLVSLPGFAHTVLTEYLFQDKRKHGLIFITQNGTPISPRNLVRHFKQVIVATGLPDIRFHDLRHTHASLLLAAGVHPKVVQERLGHSQISLTMDTYSHLLPGMGDEAASKFDDLMA